MSAHLWKAFWRINTKWIFVVLVFGGFTFALVSWKGFHYAMDMTSTTEFCISCHSMRDNLYEEYTSSIHYKNPSGVRAGCPDCHVPKSGLPFYEAKIVAVRRVWADIMGTIDTPEKFEKERLRLAKLVFANMKESDSRECRNCHQFEAMDFEHQRPTSADKMKKAMADGGTCIDCHKGIAHKLPDMTTGFKTLYSELMAASAKLSPKPGATFFTLTTVNFTTEKPGDGAETAGRLVAATPVEVLDRDGEQLYVRVTGWRQHGAERIIYALQGKRILVAALGPEAIESVKSGETITDPDTGQEWTAETLDIWIAAQSLTDSPNKLWEYGAELYTATCATCHTPTPLDHYPANEWIGVMNDMKASISLETEQYRFLQKYLQLHSADVVAGH